MWKIYKIIVVDLSRDKMKINAFEVVELWRELLVMGDLIAIHYTMKAIS